VLHVPLISYLLFNYSKRKDKSVPVAKNSYITWALNGSEWSAFTPTVFTSCLRASDTLWIGGWDQICPGHGDEDKCLYSSTSSQTPVIEIVVIIVN
jgi:hypothetical protein